MTTQGLVRQQQDRVVAAPIGAVLAVAPTQQDRRCPGQPCRITEKLRGRTWQHRQGQLQRHPLQQLEARSPVVTAHGEGRLDSLWRPVVAGVREGEADATGDHERVAADGHRQSCSTQLGLGARAAAAVAKASSCEQNTKARMHTWTDACHEKSKSRSVFDCGYLAVNKRTHSYAHTLSHAHDAHAHTYTNRERQGEGERQLRAEQSISTRSALQVVEPKYVYAAATTPLTSHPSANNRKAQHSTSQLHSDPTTSLLLLSTVTRARIHDHHECGVRTFLTGSGLSQAPTSHDPCSCGERGDCVKAVSLRRSAREAVVSIVVESTASGWRYLDSRRSCSTLWRSGLVALGTACGVADRSEARGDETGPMPAPLESTSSA